MKKTARKVLLMACSALLLVCLTVSATVAYLTSTTKVVENTFSVGKVKITLDETDVDVYGVQDGTTRVIENTYKLINGHFYTKDPTVHVADDSEESWLFVKVENGIAAIEAADGTDDTETEIDESKVKIATQMAANGWTLVEGETNVYAYKAKVEAGKDYVVFNSFTVDGEVALANEKGEPLYADAKITIQAYAVQADGFDTAADAWKNAKSTWTPDAE